MAALIFKPNQEKRLLNGHPWIYKTEMDAIKGSFKDGDIVDFLDHRKKFLGKGYANTQSQIVGRLLTTEQQPIGADFFKERIEAAAALRSRIIRDTDAYRLIYSESDLLPGLIVDRYGDYLVVQFLTLGMTKWKGVILDILEAQFQPLGIMERSDVTVRTYEGLPQETGVRRGTVPEKISITEHGLSFMVDAARGQKTGFFLDQRDNRMAARRLAKDARVLDGCCHTGAFSVAVAMGGAKEVIGLDNSAEAIALAQRHAELNGLTDLIRFEEANIFDRLRTLHQEAPFDMVILDPPAFTRGKASIPGAMRGYKDINLNALRLIRPGGFLITCSCSYHLSEALFRELLLDAANDVRRTIRVLEFRSQAPDHPALLAAPETHYLKCLILQVF